jgi:hypothetical protein
MQRRDHYSQVPGHRGLQREQSYAAPLRVIVHRIHLITVGNYQISTREIGIKHFYSTIDQQQSS